MVCFLWYTLDTNYRICYARPLEIEIDCQLFVHAVGQQQLSDT